MRYRRQLEGTDSETTDSHTEARKPTNVDLLRQPMIQLEAVATDSETTDSPTEAKKPTNVDLLRQPTIQPEAVAVTQTQHTSAGPYTELELHRRAKEATTETQPTDLR